MAKFIVSGSITQGFHVEVEADSESEARELAYESCEQQFGYFDEWDVDSLYKDVE